MKHTLNLNINHNTIFLILIVASLVGFKPLIAQNDTANTDKGLCKTPVLYPSGIWSETPVETSYHSWDEDNYEEDAGMALTSDCQDQINGVTSLASHNHVWFRYKFNYTVHYTGQAGCNNLKWTLQGCKSARLHHIRVSGSVGVSYITNVGLTNQSETILSIADVEPSSHRTDNKADLLGWIDVQFDYNNSDTAIISVEGMNCGTFLNTCGNKKATIKIPIFCDNTFTGINVPGNEPNSGHISKLETTRCAFPNPAHNELKIQGGYNTYTLFDLFGRVVVQGELRRDIETINTSSIPEGIYILHVVGNTDHGTQKIEISHKQ